MKYVEVPEKAQSIIDIDLSPDEEYPLRILKAHRASGECNIEYVEGDNLDVFDVIKAFCDRRAEVLDEAIAILEGAGKEE